MKNLLLPQLFVLMLCQPLAAQRYLPATITFHSGQIESGSVYHGSWVETPQFFFFMNQAGTEQKLSVEKIKSVKVTRKDGMVEYFECKEVMVNRSPTKIADLEIGSTPRMEKDTVFLQTFLISEVNLYLLKQDGVNHFFAEKDSLMELVFKQYLTEFNDRKLLKNNRFRQQLLAMTIDCPYLKDRILRISYDEKQIRDVLLEYNKCKKTEIEYQYKPEKLKIHFYAGAGMAMASLREVTANTGFIQMPFEIVKKGPKTIFSPVAGFLIPIPRTNGRFQIKTDVSLRRFEYAYGFESSGIEEIDITHLRSQTLLQWNFINREHKLHIQGGVHSSWIIEDESVLIYGSAGGEYLTVQRKHEFGMVVGGGYVFDRIGLEVRYDRGQGYTPSAAVSSSVQTLSMFLTYRVF